MAWLARLAGSALVAVVAVAACGLDRAGLGESADAGVDAGGTGGLGVSSGTCFPGSKVCPAPDGKLLCLTSNSADTGCQASTACDPCIVPHAQPSCSSNGKCAFETCDPGWLDCNNDPIDGCETNYEKDPSHCGSCENDCIALNGPGYLCSTGTCVPNDCQPPTTADCNGNAADVCEVDLTTDTQNCSFCGNVCALAHAQSACEATPSGNPLARCVIKVCDPGWADCDGNAANGCESSASTDPSSCGGCGKKCDSTNGVPGCVNGACVIVCNSGFGNCDGNPDNGCETVTAYDVANCGACGNVCPAQTGSPVCNNGKCDIGACNSGFADCDGNSANGCETDIASDPTHCGNCGTVCSAPAGGVAHCTGGKCGFACNIGYSSCGGNTTCFDVSADPLRCGTACQSCAAPPTGHGVAACAGGNCTVKCDAGYTACGNGCYDLTVDKTHCGSCTAVCQDPPNGTATCTAGKCTVACNQGNLTVCGSNCVNLSSDKNNCGSCGNSCSWPKTCKSSACECPTGTKDCGLGICAQCCTNSDCSKGCCLGICCP